MLSRTDVEDVLEIVESKLQGVQMDVDEALAATIKDEMQIEFAVRQRDLWVKLREICERCFKAMQGGKEQGDADEG